MWGYSPEWQVLVPQLISIVGWFDLIVFIFILFVLFCGVFVVVFVVVVGLCVIVCSQVCVVVVIVLVSFCCSLFYFIFIYLFIFSFVSLFLVLERSAVFISMWVGIGWSYNHLLVRKLTFLILELYINLKCDREVWL